MSRLNSMRQVPKPQFFVLPGHRYVAIIGKAGSSALGNAIIEAHYPEMLTHGWGGANPFGKKGVQSMVPRTSNPAGEVHIIVRNPVERFRSSCKEDRVTDVDAKLDSLESGGDAGFHFRSVSGSINSCLNPVLYRMEDINLLAANLGLATPLNIINESVKGSKPTLTDNQIVRVKSYYADDVEIYQSL